MNSSWYRRCARCHKLRLYWMPYNMWHPYRKPGRPVRQRTRWSSMIIDSSRRRVCYICLRRLPPMKPLLLSINPKLSMDDRAERTLDIVYPYTWAIQRALRMQLQHYGAT